MVATADNPIRTDPPAARPAGNLNGRPAGREGESKPSKVGDATGGAKVTRKLQVP